MARRSSTAAKAAAGVILAGVVVAAAAPPEPPRPPTPPAASPATNPATRPVDRMVDIATRRMEIMDLERSRGRGPDVEVEYRWSKRLMKARLAATADAAGRRAAVEAHRVRTVQLLEKTKAIMGASVGGGAAAAADPPTYKTNGVVASFEFYVAEAEHRLAKMDAKEGKR